jgi:hypothetical protein
MTGKYRLGKLPPRFDPNTKRLKRYMLKSDCLPTPPAQFDLSNKVSPWGMFGNDKLGDCTWAARAHLTMLFCSLVGNPVVPKDTDVQSGYLAMSPGDDGCAIIDVLDQWKNDGAPGIGSNTDKIDGYAQLDLGNRNHIQLSTFLFAGVDIGFQVPNAIWSMGKVWDVVDNDGGIDGGHSVCVVGYNDQGVLVVSWGEVYTMTWKFWAKYCDEAYTALSDDWLDKVPTGNIGFTQLAADLKLV